MLRTPNNESRSSRTARLTKNPVRPATILFCDLAGSTRYGSILGDAAYAELIYAFQSLAASMIKDLLKSHGDAEADIRGDQFCLILYGDSPSDDAKKLIEWACHFKLVWLFSDYNRNNRVNQGRSPVSLMMGIHSGNVTLQKFPRLTSAHPPTISESRLVAEGYPISIAKRVESSARKGRSWQIMLTDSVLTMAQLEKFRIEYINREDAEVLSGVNYRVSEIIDRQSNFEKAIKDSQWNESELDNIGIYLNNVCQIEPTPWHDQLASSWDFEYKLTNYSSTDEVIKSHLRALISCPDAVYIPIRLALLQLLGDPWQALKYLDDADRRTKSRGYSPGYHNLLRCMATWLSENRCRKINSADVERWCQPMHGNEIWHRAANFLRCIFLGEFEDLAKIRNPVWVNQHTQLGSQLLLEGCILSNLPHGPACQERLQWIERIKQGTNFHECVNAARKDKLSFIYPILEHFQSNASGQKCSKWEIFTQLMEIAEASNVSGRQ